MTTEIHLLSIVDYNFLISDFGLKFYKTRIVDLKYGSWTVSKMPLHHYIRKYIIRKCFYAMLQSTIDHN